MLHNSAVRILCLVAYVSVLYIVGSLIFTKGFLLKRNVVAENSTCRVDFAKYSSGENHGTQGCWLHRRFDKAVIIIIDALRNITRLLDKDTLLLVMGDHGMTSTGDHGGDSSEEIDAGLFIYSKSPITTANKPQTDYRTVSQIDIVPTVSLLLGLPIPFSNLGSVITDLFAYCSWSKESHIKEVYHIVEALRVNANQMNNYITHYMRTSSDLPSHKIAILQAKLTTAENRLQRLVTDMFIHNKEENAHEVLHDLEKEYRNFMFQMKEICREIWAKFDHGSMGFGIMFLIVAVAVNIYILCVVQDFSQDKWDGSIIIVLAVSIVFLVFSLLQVYLESSSVQILGFMLGLFDLVALAIIVQVTTSNRTERKPLQKTKYSNTWITLDTFVSTIVIALSILAYFSNSFVVFEDDLSLFCSQTMVWYICAKIVFCILKDKAFKESNKSKLKGSKPTDIRKVLVSSLLPVVVTTTACSLCIRLSANYRQKREEQLTLDLLNKDSQSEESTSMAESKNVQFFVSTAMLVLTFYLPRKWLKESGNLNGVNFTVLCARYLVPLAAVSTMFYWALHCLPVKVLDSLPVWQQTVLAEVVYVVVVVASVIFTVSPLLVYMQPKHGKQFSVPSETQGKDLVGKLYSYIKSTWTEENQAEVVVNGQSEVPRVYGLGTVFSGAIVYNGLLLLLVLSLLLGSSLAPSILCAVAAMFFFLELFSIAVKVCRDSDLILPGLVAWLCMMWTFFYGFGHQATIPAIRFEAAFVGFHGDWENKLLPAAMITSNMFAAEILFTFLSPLLILWPCTKGPISGFLFPSRHGEAGWQGDYVMFNNRPVFRELLLKLVSTTYLIQGLKLLGCIIATTIHRRHLMVWKIFAPRFVYQAISSFSVFAVALLFLATLLRVEKALGHWTEKLK
ncbi:GPI ethanolamine phosphate transferase 3-like isoform X2 [Dreissena polymorpha]|uniref:GPI ethanolamine phosphate transferase 3-like isoform X2 n=1 Tax=Dreissena polymorpha TaxID=45954 RepID=UPI002264F8AA|nr:GPI ethanolamine phosphate transferase 3-like isoform X2 [Dreissena polymorpha]